MKGLKQSNTYLVDQIFALENPPVGIALFARRIRLVDFKVILRVLELKVSLFDECGDLFKLFIGVLRMMEKDAVEDFSQVAVKVLWHIATDFLALAKLSLDSLECLLADAHLLMSLFKL